MADDNKPVKYLRYAIGEIILVVIGILIALQINTWSEKQKIKKFEKEILFLIDQNLTHDSTLVYIELFKAKRAISLTDSLLLHINRESYNTDSLNQWMGKIITFERFNSQSSAFEVLKAKGIETISNKELQLALISYYDEQLFRTYQSLGDVEQSFKLDWLPIIKEHFSEFNWLDYHIPNNPDDFYNDPSAIVLFRIFRDNRLGSVRMLEKSGKKISEIKALIKQYNKE